MRGEIVVVIHGAEEAEPATVDELLPKVAVLVEQGTRMKQAVAEVAEKFGVKKRDLYEAVLAERHEADK
ncbi:hypothetical protein D3C74_479090 [compost metagenome]